MGSESESCVDQLLIYVSELNGLIEDFKSGRTNEELCSKARERLHISRTYIEKNLGIIPNHTLKTINDSLRKLELLVEKPKSHIQFRFSSKPSQEPVSSNKNETNISEEPNKKLPSKQHEPHGDKMNCENFFGFRNQTNQSYHLDQEQARNKDISLINLSSCRVTILGLANTVHLRDLKDCLVIVFLATRAITLTNCQNCNFKFVCQQLRINSTKESSLQIFTSARSMLEESSGLKFSCLEFDQLSDIIDAQQRSRLLSEAQFDCDKNNWKCIDDFDWLNANIASKNYSISE